MANQGGNKQTCGPGPTNRAQLPRELAHSFHYHPVSTVTKWALPSSDCVPKPHPLLGSSTVKVRFQGRAGGEFFLKMTVVRTSSVYDRGAACRPGDPLRALSAHTVQNYTGEAEVRF